MSSAKQSEILFLWDGEYWNPNGDMLNDNAPRYDEVSQRALVSDVRIKRTIRDYLEQKGENIFVKEYESGDGIADAKKAIEIQLGKKPSKGDDVEQELINKCIDVRAFGGVFPVDKQSHNLTGPIQFKMSKSLNETEITFVKGTGAFASSDAKQNKTFREEYILPYALIATYGIISKLSAKKTELSQEDVKKILQGLWHGTKNLISRSKFGQVPRFLLKITYNQAGVYIGALDNLVELKSQKRGSEIRSIDEYRLDISKLLDEIEKYKEYIDSIEYMLDDNLEFVQAIPSDWAKLDIGI